MANQGNKKKRHEKESHSKHRLKDVVRLTSNLIKEIVWVRNIAFRIQLAIYY